MLYTLLIGLVIGAAAKFVMPGKDPGGILVTILLGIAGSFVAWFIGRGLGWYAPTDAAGFVASTLGAVLLLFIYRRVRKA